MRWLGPDIFISYRIAEARDYARALRDQLETGGYRCFLDEHWQPPSANIDEYKKMARRSRLFVLIGSQTVLSSQHVPRELDAYHRGHASWFSRRWNRIFPISVGGTLARFERRETSAEFSGSEWEPLIGLVAEAESESAIENGEPSEGIAKRIAGTYGLLRGTRLLAAITATISIVTLGGTFLAVGLSVRGANRQVATAIKQRDEVNDQKVKAVKAFEKASQNVVEKNQELAQAQDQVNAEINRAAEQRRIADSLSLTNRAARLSDPDELGSPNTTRALLAIKSWKSHPNPAAFVSP
jgi:hypothetical protein